MNTPNELVNALLARGMQQKEIASRLGVAQSSISRWLQGAEPRSGVLERLKGLVDEAAGHPDKSLRTTRVVGFVRAGAEMELYSEGQGPFDLAPLPDGASESTVAVVVRGDSMAGRADDGDLIYFDERRQIDDDLIGKLCVVSLVDGRVMVKKLTKANGSWILSSIAADPIVVSSPEILWVARVQWIKPR